MRRKWLLVVSGVLIVIIWIAWSSMTPSTDRDWAKNQERTARASFEGSIVLVENVRNFDHCPEMSSEPIMRWDDRRFDLEKLDSVWLGLSLFKKNWRGPAHIFLTFGFSDSVFVSVSVEARKEKGEKYSIWKGIAKKYELAYVIADERDILTLRAKCWTDRVYLYPVRCSPEKGRELFVDILKKANKLAVSPEFYHTIWNNCTTNIIAHANDVATRPIPAGYHAFLPGYTDKVAYSLGLIGAEGTLDELREKYFVNDIVRKYADHPDFSSVIRSAQAAASEE